jgi:hypothetical protein
MQSAPRSEVTFASVLVFGHSALRKVVLRHLQDVDELPPILIVCASFELSVLSL